MLVVGSSLMVYSGYRFARAMADAGKPIAAVNLGRTRADDLLALKVTDRCARRPVVPARRQWKGRSRSRVYIGSHHARRLS